MLRLVLCLFIAAFACLGCEEEAPVDGLPTADARASFDGATPDGAPEPEPEPEPDATIDPMRDATVDPMSDAAVDPMLDATVDPAPDSGVVEPPCVDPADVVALFTERCSFAGCHGGGAPAAGLRLEPAVAFDNLIGVASTQQPAMQRVAPGAPEASYLIAKLSPTPPVGSQMPLGGALTAAELALVRGWIAAGAPREACLDPGPDPEPDPSEVAEVIVDRAPLQLGIGEVTQVRARAVDAEGEAVDVRVDWISANGIVVYSDGTGGLLGVGVGETAVHAVADGISSAGIAVTVIDANPPGASFFGEVEPMLRARCAVPGCHVDGIEPGDLRFDRDADRMWEELVEDDAEEVNLPRVRPGVPAGGYLVQKLALDRPAVGGRMPLGQPPLSVDDMQKVVTWIRAGARAN